ncbi:MAG: hypothetical protein CVV64_08965 [Candidatus Wallbacteria bacterium HGW-Wallbacteria-1]|uniref:Uncharacterized protein n=1 Tax=Candidatus Wallbacteria bacterium HGW-Wallbacteria-1 TaxID=2013854 RepID=A0A2N1PQ76_9BACT|nr:MAG: hypothetical protein CVV64_08965 [Candidatus Wallbacteria bacterium HGW-Wallbacteria-1]
MIFLESLLKNTIFNHRMREKGSLQWPLLFFLLFAIFMMTPFHLQGAPLSVETLKNNPLCDNDWFSLTPDGMILFSSEGWIHCIINPGSRAVNTHTLGSKPFFIRNVGLVYLHDKVLHIRNWFPKNAEAKTPVFPKAPRKLLRNHKFQDLAVTPAGEAFLITAEGHLAHIPPPVEKATDPDLTVNRNISTSLLLPDISGRWVTLSFLPDAQDASTSAPESDSGSPASEDLRFHRFTTEGMGGTPRPLEHPTGLLMAVPWPGGRHLACILAKGSELALFDQKIKTLANSGYLSELGISGLPDRVGKIQWDNRVPTLWFSSAGILGRLIYSGPLPFSRNSIEKLATTITQPEKNTLKGVDVIAYAAGRGSDKRLMAIGSVEENLNRTGTAAEEPHNPESGINIWNWQFPSQAEWLASGGIALPITPIHLLSTEIFNCCRRYYQTGMLRRDASGGERKKP